MSASAAIRQLLSEALAHVAGEAVAFVPPSRDDFYFHTTAADSDAVRRICESVADLFLIACRNRHEPLVQNRVRYEAEGPLIGRFVAVAVHNQGQLAGVLLIFRASDQQAFGRDDGRNALQLAHQLSKAVSLATDPLTGLPTGSGVEQLVDWRLRSPRPPVESSVLYGDIDGLHVVNELLGFECGDRVIAAVARALEERLAERDAVLGRVSGDRFAIFLPHCPVERARAVADELRDAVSTMPPATGITALPLSICFGAAALRGGERSFDHALAAAQAACKTAKSRGRDRVEAYHLQDSGINRRIEDIAVVGRLSQALRQGSFKVFGQPIASLLQPERVRRYETLLRMVDDEGRLVMPAQFMLSAARYRLLPQIDRCVIADVLGKLAAASGQPLFEPLHLAINLSAPTLEDRSFVDWLLEQIDTSGARAEWLTFELTQTAVGNNLDNARRLMAGLAERGCGLALDNFGAGPGTLADLKTLNFSMLKIDGSFVRDILHDPRCESLVRAATELAHGLGMETVAEYVETPQICMRLIELQVQFGQGFAIGRPRPLDAILQPAARLASAS